jgi:hypothetical protein
MNADQNLSHQVANAHDRALCHQQVQEKSFIESRCMIGVASEAASTCNSSNAYFCYLAVPEKSRQTWASND